MKLYASFENQPEEKKLKIIKASIEEFSKKGYENASTNEIVKNAEISKGLLFHYFKNKKNLYLYLIDYVLEKLMQDFYEFAKNQPPDLFDRLIEWGMKKLEIYFKNPTEYRFLAVAFLNIPKEVKKDLMERFEKINKEVLAKILNGIDYTHFRKDIDKGKAINFIIVSIEAISNKIVEMYKNNFDDAVKNMDRIMEDFKEYMEILKNGVYDKGKA